MSKVRQCVTNNIFVLYNRKQRIPLYINKYVDMYKIILFKISELNGF